MLNGVAEQQISWVLGVVIAKEICSMPPPYAARKIVARFGEGLKRKAQMREHKALSFSLYGLDDVLKVLLQSSPHRKRILEYGPDQCAEYLNKVVNRQARFLKNAQRK